MDISLKSLVKVLLRPVVKPALGLFYSIGSSKQCNLCNWTGHHFRKIRRPEKPAPVALCPRCGSQARHRLAYYLLNSNIGSGHHTLHVAPARFVESWLRSISNEYLSIDLNPELAMYQMDLTALELEDCSYSLIWCSHVLEHISKDVKAMEEMFRVLKPGGTAIIQVSVYGDTTYEDSTITEPQDRLKHFKQKDHVRLYGLDIAERLRSVGFNVDILDISKIPPQDVERYGLDWPVTRQIFVCKHP